MNKEYLDISCVVSSNDFKIFEKVINQGIDSHLQGFIKSKFEIKKDYLVNRLYMQFHKSEINILVRRLKELNDIEFSENVFCWIEDIKNMIILS